MEAYDTLWGYCVVYQYLAGSTSLHRTPQDSLFSLRSGWNGLCRALPGERCTIAPVALQMADARARLGRTHHHKTWRTDPGRQDHTILPYADHTGRARDVFAHGCPPCTPFAPT